MFEFIEDADLRKQAEDAHTASVTDAVKEEVKKETSGLKKKTDELYENYSTP